jgi:T4-like virus Myoviridae tail sheath stabiliser
VERYTYNSEIRRMILHFLAAMDGAIVKRYDQNGVAQSEIVVNYLYANKSRVMKELVSADHNVSLPVVAVTLGGITRDNNRVKNKQAEYVQRSSTGAVKLRNAVPVNITVSMSILTKYQSDMEQIINNFVAYFDPYIYISWKEPVTEREIRSKVIWDGTATPNFQSLFEKEEYERYECDTTFTIEGYIYKSEQENVAPICTIETDYVFFANRDPFILLDEDDNREGREKKIISGIPKPRFTDTFIINADRSQNTIKLYGESLMHTDNVYISASDIGMLDMSAFSPFQDNEDKIEYFPEFNGFPAPAFRRIGETILEIDLPEFSTAGRIDIICVNTDCGYGSLIEYATEVEDFYQTPYNTVNMFTQYINSLTSSDTLSGGAYDMLVGDVTCPPNYDAWRVHSLSITDGIEVLKSFELTCGSFTGCD